MNVNGNAGRYDMTAVLGEGGMATVWRAYDRQLGREVALKALQPHLTPDAEIRARFAAESSALASLSHPNIVRVYDISASDRFPYFTMELIDGPSLADIIRRDGPQPPRRVAEALWALASAVDYLHAMGIIHRDVKAANIMVDRDGRLVLMDFGVARMLDTSGRTRAGSLLGTPEAMSPEQVYGQPAGPPADIYALGVLAFHLLTGRPPFEGDTAKVMHGHAVEPPPSLRLVYPSLPAACAAAVDAALAKQPEQRPATAGAFAQAFAAGLAPASPAVPPPLPPAGDSGTAIAPPLQVVESGGGAPAWALAVLALSALAMIASVVIGMMASLVIMATPGFPMSPDDAMMRAHMVRPPPERAIAVISTAASLEDTRNG